MEAIVKQLLDELTSHARRAEELIMRSEDRMEKTNEMVCKLAYVVEQFSQQSSRILSRYDAVMRENEQLITMNKQLVNILTKQFTPSGVEVVNNFDK